MFNYIIEFLTPSKVNTNILIFSNSVIYQPSISFKRFFKASIILSTKILRKVLKFSLKKSSKIFVNSEKGSNFAIANSKRLAH